MTVHVTIEMDETVKADLDEWARNRGVPVGTVLAEAVSLYVADQREMQAAIEEGLASLERGEGVPHEEVVSWLRQRRQDWGQAE